VRAAWDADNLARWPNRQDGDAVCLTRLPVKDRDDLRRVVQYYTPWEYTVVNESETAVTLFKHPQVRGGCATLTGGGLFILPFVVWAARREGDQQIDIVIAEHGYIQLSPGRDWWWNGTEWIDAWRSMPPHTAKLDETRSAWWDGATWRQFGISIRPSEPKPSEPAPSLPR